MQQEFILVRMFKRQCRRQRKQFEPAPHPDGEVVAGIFHGWMRNAAKPSGGERKRDCLKLAEGP
jgi:redox-sensitive bicupin YhaK (pirin superfamily)